MRKSSPDSCSESRPFPTPSLSERGTSSDNSRPVPSQVLIFSLASSNSTQPIIFGFGCGTLPVVLHVEHDDTVGSLIWPPAFQGWQRPLQSGHRRVFC